MTTELVRIEAELDPAEALGLAELRRMVLNSGVSKHTQRNYAKALDEFFALSAERRQPLSRDLLMEYRAQMLVCKLSPSTVNVRLSAVRKLIEEAKRKGIRSSLARQRIQLTQCAI
jgi:site-specific recombinase XerD